MMKRKKYTAGQIVAKLQEAEVLLGKGMAMREVRRQLEITGVTYDKDPDHGGWVHPVVPGDLCGQEDHGVRGD